MANKAISELPQAQNVNNQDLFVLEQSGIAKKLTAETFITEQGIIDALAEALDGHGGITSVTLQSISGRVRTYQITFTDETTTTFQVLDGTSISRIEKTSTAGLVDTYTVFMTDGTTSFFQVRNGQDGSATWDQINSKAPIITDTVTGAIVTFPDGADDIPVTSLVVNIEPKQSGSGDPSPSNIRPISGWTGCNVTRAGKNLFDVISAVAGQTDASGASTTGYTLNGDKVTVSKDTSYYGRVLFGKQYLTAGTYTFSCSVSYSGNSSTRLAYSVRNMTSLVDLVPLAIMSAPESLTFSFTVTDGDYYAISVQAENSASLTPTLSNLQLELGSTATTYEPYQGTTLTVDWTTEAGTVYGGHLTINEDGSCDVVAEITSQTITGDDLNLSQNIQPEGNLWRLTLATSRPHPASVYSDALCNSYKVVKSYSAVNNTNDSIALNNSAMEQILVRNDNFTTRQEIIDGLNASPIQLVYELATPITTHLPSVTMLKTLLGTNNVWADIGNVSVTYPADTKMYIQNLTQPTEDDLVANQAITSGEYFMVGNSLYLALANIANGAQITIGTNAQRVSLADALNAINS